MRFGPTFFRSILIGLVCGLWTAHPLAAETAKPQRIISLLPSLTEMVFGVGAGERVVGVTRSCTYPPEAAKRTHIGGYVPNTISLELIVGLQPDLVLAQSDIQGSTIEQLHRFGIRVEPVDARSVTEIAPALRRVGELVGESDQAARVADALERELERIRSSFAEVSVEERPRVFYEVWFEPLMTAGRRSFTHQLIELAGGVNVFADTDRDYFQVSLEEVLRRDPDVVLGSDSHGSREQLTTAERPGWGKLRAVQAGNVHAIDGDIVSRPGPRIAEALRRIVAILHPERMPPGS
ncbi:MAG: cobalamin-binding protein [Acidobacteriota bacterium]